MDGFYCDPREGEGVRGFPAARPNPPLPPRPRSSPSPLTPAGGLRPDNQRKRALTGRLGRAGSRKTTTPTIRCQNPGIDRQSSCWTRGRRPNPALSMIPSPVQGENGVSPELQAGCSGLVRHLTFPNTFGVGAVWKPTVCSCLRLGEEVGNFGHGRFDAAESTLNAPGRAASLSG